MAAPRPAIIQEPERSKIVTLYRDHAFTLPRLRARLGLGVRQISRVLHEENVPTDRRSRVYQEAP